MMRMHSSHCLHMWPSQVMQVHSHIPLSEQEVIDISSVLLTPGIHYIKVESVEQGREIMRTFLTKLSCYHDIAYLGLDPMPPKDKVLAPYVDVYTTLINQGVLQKSTGSLAEFFCTHLYCDFLWIEATTSLMAAPWFEEFEQVMFELQLDTTIPIIVLSYV